MNSVLYLYYSVCYVDVEVNSGLSLGELLAFWTGADEVPPCGFEDYLQIQFFSCTGSERRLPTASTCSLVLWLPRNISEPQCMWSLLYDAVNMSGGFGKI